MPHRHRRIMRVSVLVACAALTESAIASPLDLVGPGIVSTDAVEYGAAVDPLDGALYFVRTDAPWGTDGCGRMLRSARDAASWRRPEVVLADASCHGDPFVSTDGRRLYFTSDAHDEPDRTDTDIWVATRGSDGWRNPRRVDGVNSPADEYSPVETAAGTLYFASSREGGRGQGDLWRAARRGDGFAPPQNLGPPVNTAHGEWNLLVAPDESWLIVEASGRAEGLSPSGDLYVSFAQAEGWSAPMPLSALNTEGSELMPRLSPDGGTLYYTSTRVRAGRNADILAAPLAPVLASGLAARGGFLLAVSRSAHHLALVDAASMTVSTRLATGPGPHEVALSSDGRHAFVPAYGVYPEPHDGPVAATPPRFVEVESNTVRRFDLIGGTHVDFTICPRSHGVTTTPDDRLWVTCEEDATVLELNAVTGETLKTWPAGHGAHQLAASADGRRVVAANVESGSITIIDRGSGKTRTIDTGAGAEGLAIAPDGGTLWVGNAQANTISIVRMETGEVETTVDSGGRFPVKLAFAPDGSEVWVVNTFSRSVAVFDAVKREITETLDFPSPPLGIAFAPEGARIYLSFPRLNAVRALDTATREEVGSTDGIIEADGIVVLGR